MYKAYCMKCKEKVEISDHELTDMKGSKGKRPAVKGKCSKCNTNVYAILKADGTQN